MMVIYIRGWTDFCLVVILKSIVLDRKPAKTFSSNSSYCLVLYLKIYMHFMISLSKSKYFDGFPLNYLPISAHSRIVIAISFIRVHDRLF